MSGAGALRQPGVQAPGEAAAGTVLGAVEPAGGVWSPRQVEVPGGPVTIFESGSLEHDLNEAIETGAHPPYGRVLWASAPCVAAVLSRLPLSERLVLELGCGTGLVALVAARLGARVLATDADGGALEATRRGVAVLGPAAERVEVKAFDIGSALPLPAADIVVAADLLYEHPLARSVARRTLEALRRGSTVVVGDPGRAGREAFESCLAAAGCAAPFAREVALPFVADVLVLGPESRS